MISSGPCVTPGITAFIAKGPDSVIGSYQLEEHEGPTLGVLSGCRVLGPRDLWCVWRDKYGVGAFQATFAADGSSFTGYWNPRGKNQLRFPYNGSRTLPGRSQADSQEIARLHLPLCGPDSSTEPEQKDDQALKNPD